MHNDTHTQNEGCGDSFNMKELVHGSFMITTEGEWYGHHNNNNIIIMQSFIAYAEKPGD